MACVALILVMSCAPAGASEQTLPVSPGEMQSYRLVIVERDVPIAVWHRWGVARAIAQWDRAPGLVVRAGRCDVDHAGCIRVGRGPLVDGPVAYARRIYLVDSGRTVSYDVVLQRGRWSGWMRHLAAVHELGHGLGVEHSPDPLSVMTARPGSQTRTTPTWAELEQVGRAYSTLA